LTTGVNFINTLQAAFAPVDLWGFYWLTFPCNKSTIHLCSVFNPQKNKAGNEFSPSSFLSFG